MRVLVLGGHDGLTDRLAAALTERWGADAVFSACATRRRFPAATRGSSCWRRRTWSRRSPAPSSRARGAPSTVATVDAEVRRRLGAAFETMLTRRRWRFWGSIWPVTATVVEDL